MASPQTEHGYTKIANALMRALFRFPFSGQELRLLLWALRDSYGWNRKITRETSLAMLVEETGIPTATVSYALTKLDKGNVLIKQDDKTLRFNKNYEAWLLPGAGMLPLTSKGQKKEKPSAGADTSPSLDEVKVYCKDAKIDIDPDKFFHHFESTGWMKGKTPIKNWKRPQNTGSIPNTQRRRWAHRSQPAAVASFAGSQSSSRGSPSARPAAPIVALAVKRRRS